MLLALVTPKVVKPREALGIVASTKLTEEGILGRWLVNVFLLVTSEILRVQETFMAMLALVRPLRTVQMCLLVTTGITY
jgi:hypothetical protein